MKICCFGSLNIDYVYRVNHFVETGETIRSINRDVICGGKGLNQSIALARSGAKVFHAGNVGISDGHILIKALRDAHVDVTLINKIDTASGHAIIQVDEKGENCILLYGGANQRVTDEQIEQVLENFGEGDFLVLQNEINALQKIIKAAHAKKMKVFLNPSPVEGILGNVPLECVDYLFVNWKECCQIGGKASHSESIASLRNSYPNMSIICTLGSRGAEFHGAKVIELPALPARKVRDTTGAGDTFMGYFIGSMADGHSVNNCMLFAIAAATLCVENEGASASIPFRKEVEELLKAI